MDTEHDTVMEEACLSIVTHKKHCRQLRVALQHLDLLEPSLRLHHLAGDEVALPCRCPRGDTAVVEARLAHHLHPAAAELSDPEATVAPPVWRLESSLSFAIKSSGAATQTRKLLTALRRLVEECGGGVVWTPELSRAVPDGWERHGDLVLLPSDAFLDPYWLPLDGPQLWTTVADALGAARLARRRGQVLDDDFRRPQVALLLGNDGWVTHIDNHIRYCFDVTRCMFSAGNVSEKLRVAKFDCEGQVVLDMFAGIGYFTLPYLVHTGARLVHACEWNPDSLVALERTLSANGVASRCVVHAGDNRQVAPVGVAQRINLGLIPSSRGSWPAACRALDPRTGGWMHVHGNVTSWRAGQSPSTSSPPAEWGRWAVEVRAEMSAILRDQRQRAAEEATTGVDEGGSVRRWRVLVRHVECVKSYAPHVHHLVVDLECRPEVVIGGHAAEEVVVVDSTRDSAAPPEPDVQSQKVYPALNF